MGIRDKPIAWPLCSSSYSAERELQGPSPRTSPTIQAERGVADVLDDQATGDYPISRPDREFERKRGHRNCCPPTLPQQMPAGCSIGLTIASKHFFG
jgi:hypothetical protein